MILQQWQFKFYKRRFLGFIDSILQFSHDQIMFKRIFLILSFFVFNLCEAYHYDLSICAIFQNESPYLKEWIQFHRLAGVQHFYLYNHYSTDDYLKVLAPYIRKGYVDLIELPVDAKTEQLRDFNELQCFVYTYTAAKTRGITKWLACIDVDEYLYPIQHMSLVKFLEAYEECAGIGVNWHMFGTSSIERIPSNQLMIETLTKCAKKDHNWQIQIKSIVRPECITHFTQPHSAVYLPGFTQVNSDSVPFEGPFSPYIQLNKIRINHYWTKDVFFFENYKIPRRGKWGDDVVFFRQIAQEFNEEEDLSIQKYVPFLKKIKGL